MSIIQEALKKAQDIPRLKDKSNKIGTAEHAPETIVKTPRSIASPVSNKFAFKPVSATLITAIIVAIAIVAILFLFLLNKGRFLKNEETIKPDAHQQVTYKPLPSGDAAKKPEDVLPSVKPIETVFEVKPQLPQLILNGIMYMEGSPRAIINGNVIEEGDSVSGAEVKKITRNNVVLKFKDTEIVIDLK